MEDDYYIKKKLKFGHTPKQEKKRSNFRLKKKRKLSLPIDIMIEKYIEEQKSVQKMKSLPILLKKAQKLFLISLALV